MTLVFLFFICLSRFTLAHLECLWLRRNLTGILSLKTGMDAGFIWITEIKLNTCKLTFSHFLTGWHITLRMCVCAPIGSRLNADRYGCICRSCCCCWHCCCLSLFFLPQPSFLHAISCPQPSNSALTLAYISLFPQISKTVYVAL